MSDFADIAHVQPSVTHWLVCERQIPIESATNWRWHMKHQISSTEDAQKYLSLSDQELGAFEKLSPQFHGAVTPYYMGLMRRDSVECPVRLQALPQMHELIDDIGLKDPLSEVPLSPVKEVVHMYPDRVAFCVAQLCPVYCRYCFRKRRDEEEGLHFNRRIIEEGIAYIRSMPSIKDVLVTGGDPFVASDQAIEKLLIELRSIPHVEVIRFGTRTPVTLPYRVTKDLCSMLSKYHPIWVNTHFNCVEEMTPEAIVAIENLVNAGIPVGNQSVLLKGVNDTYEKLSTLLRTLIKHRVRPYYLFHPHRVAGTKHLRVSLETGQNLMRSLRGNISGYAIPQYVVDTMSGKIPVTPNYFLGKDGDEYLFENNRGEIWREKIDG
jgi:lysine 2,3-aminomutase